MDLPILIGLIRIILDRHFEMMLDFIKLEFYTNNHNSYYDQNIVGTEVECRNIVTVSDRVF